MKTKAKIIAENLLSTIKDRNILDRELMSKPQPLQGKQSLPEEITIRDIPRNMSLESEIKKIVGEHDEGDCCNEPCPAYEDKDWKSSGKCNCALPKKIDALITLFKTYIPKKRIMVNPVPDSDFVIGWNAAINEILEKINEKTGTGKDIKKEF